MFDKQEWSLKSFSFLVQVSRETGGWVEEGSCSSLLFLDVGKYFVSEGRCDERPRRLEKVT